MSGVFLSASIPSDDERGASVAPYHAGDIAAAASSVIEAVLRSGADLVFGGHPTITPIVLQIAALLRVGPQVHIWQSEYFLDSLTDEARRLVSEESAYVHMVPSGSDRTSSLEMMRNEMLTRPDLEAAFFVGGMEGIAAELNVLASRNPPVPCCAFTTPGGMAARLARAHREPGHSPSPGAPAVHVLSLEGRAYGSLAMSGLESVGLTVRRHTDEL